MENVHMTLQEDREAKVANKRSKKKKHTTPGIRWSSPNQLLIWQSLVYRWDPEFPSTYGRMYLLCS